MWCTPLTYDPGKTAIDFDYAASRGEAAASGFYGKPLRRATVGAQYSSTFGQPLHCITDGAAPKLKS